jgi:hypothetical protein
MDVDERDRTHGSGERLIAQRLPETTLVRPEAPLQAFDARACERERRRAGERRHRGLASLGGDGEKQLPRSNRCDRELALALTDQLVAHRSIALLALSHSPLVTQNYARGR